MKLDNSERILAEFKKEKVPCELIVIEGAGHGFPGEQSARARRQGADRVVRQVSGNDDAGVTATPKRRRSNRRKKCRGRPRARRATIERIREWTHYRRSNQAAMSIANDSSPAPRQSLRFGLRSLLWLTVVIALGLCCVLQRRELSRTQLALALTAWATSDVSIPAGKFRLMVNRIVDDNDLKVCVIRFEANRECYVSVGGQSSITSPMEDSEIHWAEIKLFGNYDAMDRHFSLLTRVGSGTGYAGGKSVHTLRPDDKPEDFLNITVKPELYDLNKAVEVYREDGKPVMLTVK